MVTVTRTPRTTVLWWWTAPSWTVTKTAWETNVMMTMTTMGFRIFYHQDQITAGWCQTLNRLMTTVSFWLKPTSNNENNLFWNLDNWLLRKLDFILFFSECPHSPWTLVDCLFSSFFISVLQLSAHTDQALWVKAHFLCSSSLALF